MLVAGLCAAAPAGAQTAAGPRASDSAPGQAASDEIRALDQQVQIILTEARRQQAQLAEQRQRLAAAEAMNAWLPWLLLALLGLALLAVGLGLRLRRLQRALAQRPAAAERPSAPGAVAVSPDDAAVAAPSAEPLLLSARTPALPSAPDELTQGQPRLMSAPAAPAEKGLTTRDFSLGTGVPPRPVSVEELLDLDQQVDFFLALGQAHAAVDLLLGHVRATGGANALPYFKLLEIYRQEGDAEAYERTRERFNLRFNANAPDWSGDLEGGRSLEDHPEVLLRLQRAWPQPSRAVAEIDSLLLRRADLEPFDLPAYRDLLLLHALVRDLPAAPELSSTAPAAPITTPAVLSLSAAEPSGAAPTTVDAVDLLLPLGEGPLDITAPRPHLSEAGSAQAMLADWVFTRAVMARQTGDADAASGAARPLKLDLDLSEHAPAPREFTRPAAFTDIDLRDDPRLSDLGGLDHADSDPTPLPSRR